MNAFEPLTAAETESSARDKPAADVDFVPLPAPAGPDPEPCHPELGRPAQIWPYAGPDGSLEGFVCRFDLRDGKEYRPFRYGRRKERDGWCWVGWRDQRPLYRLPELLARPEASVLVVEGEKTAEAAARLYPEWCATTAMNGSSSPHRTDWGPVAGRRVTIWRDADEAGSQFANEVARLATEAGADEVRIVQLPDGTPDGWDLADELPQGWSSETIAAALGEAPIFEPVSEEQGLFRVQRRAEEGLAPGVYVLDPKADPAADRAAGWIWLCSLLEVRAYCRDHDGEGWGRLVAVHDRDGQVHCLPLPMATFASDGAEYRRLLLQRGLDMVADKTSQALLSRYLTTWRPRQRVRLVSTVGWHQGRFVLPDRTFGRGDEEMILNSPRPPVFVVSGTLDGWREEVARLAIGNTRLSFAIAAAFAGPLLHLLGTESGGFHFQGASSIGKTTLIEVARCVWGAEKRTWRTTDNAAEAAAEGACDTLLALDEVSQADPRVLDAMAYMLANGGGKGRATRTGDARPVRRWRLLFISTGELGLTDKLAEGGKLARAGQSVRVLEIPADAGKGHGVLETLHEFETAGALVGHFLRASVANAGHAARAYLEAITNDAEAIAGQARDIMDRWVQINLPHAADGQVQRAAGRFALVAAAGELATSLGVVPWPAGEASEAAAACFRAWLERRGGTGPAEIMAGISQVRAFLEAHGTSRFEDFWARGESPASEPVEIFSGSTALRTMNRVGVRRTTLGQDGCAFLVFPEAWRATVCSGFDSQQIAKAMVDHGWMKSGNGRNLTVQTRIPGMRIQRVYWITPDFLSADPLATIQSRIDGCASGVPTVTTAYKPCRNAHLSEVNQTDQILSSSVPTVPTVPTTEESRPVSAGSRRGRDVSTRSSSPLPVERVGTVGTTLYSLDSETSRHRQQGAGQVGTEGEVCQAEQANSAGRAPKVSSPDTPDPQDTTAKSCDVPSGMATGEVCRICGEAITDLDWRYPGGSRVLPFADGTFVHVACDEGNLARQSSAPACRRQ